MLNRDMIHLKGDCLCYRQLHGTSHSEERRSALYAGFCTVQRESFVHLVLLSRQVLCAYFRRRRRFQLRYESEIVPSDAA
jgi:hypothetical protein